MTETPRPVPIEPIGIGAELATELAGHAYTLHLDALLKNQTPHSAAASLWTGLRPFATQLQDNILAALEVERATGYGLTPPEVVALPREVQEVLQRYRRRHASERNAAQQAYEARTGAEGLYTLEEREIRELELPGAFEAAAELEERASTAGVSPAFMASVELLDRHLPGWEAHIDTSLLNMMSPTRCVLGQLAGERPELTGCSGYHDVRNVLAAKEPALFAEPGATAFDHGRSDWIRIIRDRQTSGALAPSAD